jgi:hypothetical protein
MLTSSNLLKLLTRSAQLAAPASISHLGMCQTPFCQTTVCEVCCVLVLLPRGVGTCVTVKLPLLASACCTSLL